MRAVSWVKRLLVRLLTRTTGTWVGCGSTAPAAMTTLDDALARVSVSPACANSPRCLSPRRRQRERRASLATRRSPSVLDAAGMRGRTQWLDANAANAWGVLGSTGPWPVACCSTRRSTRSPRGDPALGLPWASQQPRPDMEPEPQPGARLAGRVRSSEPQGPRRVRAHGRRSARGRWSRFAGTGRRRFRMPGNAHESAGAASAGRPRSRAARR